MQPQALAPEPEPTNTQHQLMDAIRNQDDHLVCFFISTKVSIHFQVQGNTPLSLIRRLLCQDVQFSLEGPTFSEHLVKIWELLMGKPLVSKEDNAAFLEDVLYR